MDFVGNALKCYKGHFLDYEGGEKQSKLRLEDCEFSDEDVCVSGYAKTNFLDSDGAPVLAGSWDKYCESKSYLLEVSEEFPTHGVYDRCFKSNAGDHLVMVRNTKVFKSLVLSRFSPHIISIVKWDLGLRKISTCRIHLSTL